MYQSVKFLQRRGTVASASGSHGPTKPSWFVAGVGAKAASLLLQAGRPSASAPENLTASFAMSPFFPSTQIPPIQLSAYAPCPVLPGEWPWPRARADEPVLSP